MSTGMPLRCKARQGAIDMAIGAKTLRFSANNHPDFWDPEADRQTVQIHAWKTFAADVVREINAEGEDGSTLLTRMLDEAIKRAIENGSMAVEYIDSPLPGSGEHK